MKINSRIHGAMDYGVALFLLFSPTFFNLPEITSNFTYALGLIHLTLSAATNYELGIFRVLPFKVHGALELIVSVTLVGAAFYFGDLEGIISKIYYLTFAAAVFVVWLMTDYKTPPAVRSQL